jgi:nitric oxide reductase subunit B
VGAGLFGFLINPPLALYYMQGLNLTPLHGHTALFGVYGMLWHRPDAVLPAQALKLAAVQWRRRTCCYARILGTQHRPGPLMALLSLLPMGVLQLNAAAIDQGYWYARSAEFMGRARSSRCWCGCACPATRSSRSARCCVAWFTFRLWVAPQRERTVIGEAEESRA